jgi:hypothetical protein
MKRIILALGLFAAIASCNFEFTAEYVATAGEEANLGVCLAFLGTQQDTTSECYTSCETTSDSIYSLLLNAEWTTTYFQSSTFLNSASITLIYAMAQMSDCKMTEFLIAVNNRLSDPAFAAGLAANLIAQAALCSSYTVFDSNGDFVLCKGTNSALWEFFYDILPSY